MHSTSFSSSRCLLFLAALSILGCANDPPATREVSRQAKAPNYSIGLVNVTGPDTLTIGGVRYRLAGIKAFPDGSCEASSSHTTSGGTQAHLERITAGRTIICHEVGRRVRGVRSAICDTKTGELNHLLVARGLARAARFGHVGSRYVPAESRAIREKAGFHGCS